MALIAKHVIEHIGHGLSGELASPLSGLGLLNEAGEYLTTMRRWGFLEQRPTSLDVVGGQNYVDLPSDFQELQDAESTDGTLGTVQLTTPEYLLRLRTDDDLTPGWIQHVAVLWSADANGVPTPRLELWPTPASSESGAISILYRSGWNTITDDAQRVPIPPYCRTLYIALARAFAAGYEEHDEGSLSQRLTEIQVGPLFVNAAEADAAVQVDYGTLEGGAAQRHRWPVSSDWPWVGPTP